MDPELYAALPPDKKEEYKKMFPKPVKIWVNKSYYEYSGMHWFYKEPITISEPLIQPIVEIDNCMPEGYALFGGQFVALPDAQTCTSMGSYEMDTSIPQSEGYILHFKSEASPTYLVDPIKSQSDIGLSPGEQRLIKKGVVEKYK